MRICDDVSDKKLDRITLFLNEEEVLKLESYLKDYIEKYKEKKDFHFHISSEDYKKELTVCIYNPDNIEMLHPRAQKLIRDDE